MTQAMHSLVLFVILAVNSAASMLVAHAVIPSLIMSGDVPPDFSRFRPMLYTIFAVSVVATAFAFARAIILAIALVSETFPRFVI
jgi:hypothetical protein